MIYVLKGSTHRNSYIFVIFSRVITCRHLLKHFFHFIPVIDFMSEFTFNDTRKGVEI